jgi:hypothetical protein
MSAACASSTCLSSLNNKCNSFENAPDVPCTNQHVQGTIETTSQTFLLFGTTHAPLFGGTFRCSEHSIVRGLKQLDEHQKTEMHLLSPCVCPKVAVLLLLFQSIYVHLGLVCSHACRVSKALNFSLVGLTQCPSQSHTRRTVSNCPSRSWL